MPADTANAPIHAELARLAAAVAAQDEAIVTALFLATTGLEDGAIQLDTRAKAAHTAPTRTLPQTAGPDPRLVNEHLQRLYAEAAQRRRAQDRTDAMMELRHQPNETQ